MSPLGENALCPLHGNRLRASGRAALARFPGLLGTTAPHTRSHARLAVVWLGLLGCAVAASGAGCWPDRPTVPLRQPHRRRAAGSRVPQQLVFGAVLLQHGSAHLDLRALRGGGSGSSDARRTRDGDDNDDGDGDDEPSIGLPPAPVGGGEGQTMSGGHDDDDDFSLGAVSDAPAGHAADGAGPSTVRADGADGGAGRAVEETEQRGEVSEERDDEADVIECTFERVGDTNGVFYYLGMQMCAESADDAMAQALNAAPVNAALAGAGEHDGRRRFQNPAITGRVLIKTGPQRIMCGSKFKGHMACPEEVLERNVVGDQFWFPDGWFAIDLGLHTSLQVGARRRGVPRRSCRAASG